MSVHCKILSFIISYWERWKNWFFQVDMENYNTSQGKNGRKDMKGAFHHIFP